MPALRSANSADISALAESPNTGAWGYGNDFFAREFWRFVMVQQYVAKLAETAINYQADAGPGVLQP